MSDLATVPSRRAAWRRYTFRGARRDVAGVAAPGQPGGPCGETISAAPGNGRTDRCARVPASAACGGEGSALGGSGLSGMEGLVGVGSSSLGRRPRGRSAPFGALVRSSTYAVAKRGVSATAGEMPTWQP